MCVVQWPNVNKLSLKALLVCECFRLSVVGPCFIPVNIMEGSRRTPLLVFLATVLLLCGVSNEQASTCTPGMSKDELGRATVAAAGVFEGRLEVLGGPPASSSSLFVAGEANATFTFRRPHKGKFKQVTRAEPRPQVVVRLGLTGDAQVPRTDNVASCSWSDVLVLQENYLVFVGRSSKNSDGQSGVVYFQSTAFPVRSTKDAVKQIRAYRCRKCGQCFSMTGCIQSSSAPSAYSASGSLQKVQGRTGPQGRSQCGLDSIHRRSCGTCL